MDLYKVTSDDIKCNLINLNQVVFEVTTACNFRCEAGACARGSVCNAHECGIAFSHFRHNCLCALYFAPFLGREYLKGNGYFPVF